MSSFLKILGLVHEIKFLLCLSLLLSPQEVELSNSGCTKKTTHFLSSWKYARKICQIYFSQYCKKALFIFNWYSYDAEIFHFWCSMQAKIIIRKLQLNFTVFFQAHQSIFLAHPAAVQMSWRGQCRLFHIYFSVSVISFVVVVWTIADLRARLTCACVCFYMDGV